MLADKLPIPASAARTDLQNDVGLAAKIRIHLAIKRRFQILNGEAALLRIVAAQLGAAVNVIGR